MIEIFISRGQIFPTKVRSNIGISGDFRHNCLDFFMFPVEGAQATTIGKTCNWWSKVMSSVLTFISTWVASCRWDWFYYFNSGVCILSSDFCLNSPISSV